jgi:hypothetical protein
MHRLVPVALACCVAAAAAACSKKKSGAGGGSGSTIAGSGSADAVDAAPAVAAVIDPLPDAVWSTPVPPYRLSSTPLALWADDKRAVAVVKSLDETRVAGIDLATGAVTYSAPVNIKLPMRLIVKLSSGDLVGIGGSHESPQVFTIDPVKLTMTPRQSALGSTSLRLIDRAAVGPDGTIVLGGISQTLWTLSPDLGAAKKIETATGWRGLAFVDAKRLIGSNNRDEVWSIDPSGATPKTRIPGARGTVLAASPAGTAVASHDDGSVLFDLATGAERAKLSLGKLQSAAYSADGATLFVHERGDLVIRDGSTGAEKKRIAIGTGYTYDSATARMVVASSKHVVAMAGAAVRVVDVTAGTVPPLGSEPTRAPRLLAFSGDDLISIGLGSALKFSSTGKAEPIAGLDTHDMSTAALSPSGKLLAIADDNGVVVLDLASTTKQARPVADVGTVAISDDAMVTFDRSDFDKGATTIDTVAPGGKVDNLVAVHIDSTVDSFTTDAKRAVITRGGNAVIYDLAADKAIAKAAVPQCESTETFYISEDGARVATTHGKVATAWDVAADKPLATVDTGITLQHAFPLSGSTDVLLVAATGIVVWDTAGATAKLTRLPGHVADAIADRAGKRVAISFGNGRIAVYDLAKLKSGGEAVKLTPIDHPSSCDPDPLASPGEEEIGDGDGDE